MRITMIHNHYQLRGGEDESFQSEAQLLMDAGHDVQILTEHNDRVAELGTMRTALRTVWSSEAYQRVRAALRRHRSDLLHVQNFFPLFSPAVYYGARAEGVAVVQSLRNYRLLCPNALFFRDGRVCEDCMGRIAPWPGILHGCYRDSRGASAAVAAMITLHRVAKTWEQQPDVYIALTEFARNKFVAGGIPSSKVLVKPNFVHPDPGVGGGRSGGALFVGRLTAEKGIGTLLSAWERIGEQVPLQVVGDGPLAPAVEAAARRTSGIEFLGHRTVSEVHALMKDAAFLVLPSEWYETFGRVAVEAFATGTPVIAAQIGAVAEVVSGGETGLLFEPGDVNDLVTKVEWARSHPQEIAAMGHAARKSYEATYTAHRNYEILMDIYAVALSRSGARNGKRSVFASSASSKEDTA